jgi:hypothetical protein
LKIATLLTIAFTSESGELREHFCPNLCPHCFPLLLLLEVIIVFSHLVLIFIPFLVFFLIIARLMIMPLLGLINCSRVIDLRSLKVDQGDVYRLRGLIRISPSSISSRFFPNLTPSLST